MNSEAEITRLAKENEKYQKIMPRTHFSPTGYGDYSLFSLYLYNMGNEGHGLSLPPMRCV